MQPRGLKVMLPHGGLPEAISPYMLDLIEKTGGAKGPLGLQFIAQPAKESRFSQKHMDPLNEDENEVAPGLIYKYRGRVLWTITRLCATYCRFCTRGREVGIPAHMKPRSKATIANKFFLSDQEIEKVFTYLKNHREINEVILSGGDPLTAPQPYLEKIIQGLASLQKHQIIDIIRIGTRLPIHNPPAVQEWHYKLLSNLKNPYLMLHVNHPAELTEQAIKVLDNFRHISKAIILSQSVFLKGVNESTKTLYELFTKMTKEGIRPYYLLQNDAVYWAQHFTVPAKKAFKIWGRLRPMLSGIAATAKLVIDVAHGYGKIPLPEGNSWDFDHSYFYDFKGKKYSLK